MFRVNRRVWMLATAGVLLAAAGCPENSQLDDGNSPPVVFEIQVLTTPPVTAAQVGGSCATVAFEVKDWSATAINSPKSALAITSPFNDIDLTDVTISYRCDTPLAPICGTTRTFGITGNVPANSTVGFTFPPAFLQDITLALQGYSLGLDMVFRARAISGETLSYSTGAVLAVNACTG